MALGKRERTVDARRAGSIDAALRRSLRAAVASDWPTAETWLERIVEADSSDLDVYLALARLYREQGAIGRAIRMHQNLLLGSEVGRAERAEALLELARDFDAGGFKERAAASYEEVLDAQPRQAEALGRLVWLSLESRDYDRGLALAKRWRRLDREAALAAELELLLCQAQSRIEEGDHGGARSSLKRCLRADKHCGAAWAMLGQLEVERGKDAKALDAWRRGALADPAMAPALYPKIAAGYAALGKSQDFEKFLKGVLESRPDDDRARIALARAIASRGEAKVAIEELARAIERAPAQTGLRVELGRQLLAEGQEGEALKAYASLLDALDASEGEQGSRAADASGTADTSDASDTSDTREATRVPSQAPGRSGGARA